MASLVAGVLAATVGVVLPTPAAASPVGGEFRVNSFTAGAQYEAESAMDADGDFVVVWNSDGQDGSNNGVYGRRYSAAGTPVAGEFLVNTFTTDHQWHHKVAMDDAGGFVVVWESWGQQDGSGSGIYLQRYSSSGARLGGETRVNTTTAGFQGEPTVAMDADGDFVVAWISSSQDGAGWGVFARRYSRTGSPAGGEFQVNTYTTGDQYRPAAAMDADGDFVIAWTSDGQDGSGLGVFAQRFSPAGARLGTEFRANSYTASSQASPTVAREDNGDFVIAWQGDFQDGSGLGVFGQRYSAAGSAIGAEFQVNTFTSGAQGRPSAAMDADGDFVIAWDSYAQDGPGAGVYAQRFSPTGARLGSEIQVNTFTAGWQVRASAAMDNDGDHVVVWDSENQDGSGSGVYGQRFDAGTPEVCDGIDNDLDGSIDEGVTTTYYRDADGDRYGGATTTNSCSAPAGYVATAGDCNDANASINPGATESYNGVDDDCDGSVDEGFTAYYADGDGDGWGSGSPVHATSQPTGHVTSSGDADDSDNTVYPGAPEVDDGKDNDQDGQVDEGLDGDGDGYTPVHGADCDDSNESVNPGAAETYNGIDDDCDGSVDEGFTAYYADGDGDGWGSGSPVYATSQPTGHVTSSGDADDSDNTVYPGAAELCDGKDNDQDGDVDEGVKTTFYADADGDGYGDSATATDACSAPAGHVTASGDADDGDATVYPGAEELDDGKDNDQDGEVDEGHDADGDGYTRVFGGDCDDANASVSPGAAEADNGVDDDCNGSVDDGLDSDGDGFTPVYGGDCDDADASVSPVAAEADNGVDDDCDGSVDEGLDADGDGFTPVYGGDADDSDATVYPGASELCDGKDNDQNASVDDGWPDSDADGTADCVDPDDDGDGISDALDPDSIAAVVAALADSSFQTAGHRSAILGRLNYVETLIAAGDTRSAIKELESLRKRLDGCNGSSRERPDRDDLIINCADQRLVRGLLDTLTANLSA